MPYDYYALPYCKPKRARQQSENLGEVLSGDRIEDSVYKVSNRHYIQNIFPALTKHITTHTVGLQSPEIL